MLFVYPFIISFILIFLAELGDKTQILVLSFSAKNKTNNVLIGVALGTLFSHGIAIIFGSHLGIIENANFIYYLKLLTYFTFFLLGITGFFKSKNANSIEESTNIDSKLVKFLNSFSKYCILTVTFAIAIGELGDKTFLSSIGLGLQYPYAKSSLICGSICGMVASNSIAIFFGKWLSSKISTSTIETISNIIFILFGIIGLATL